MENTNDTLAYSPETRLDNFVSSIASSFAIFPANSLLSAECELHYKRNRFMFNICKPWELENNWKINK